MLRVLLDFIFSVILLLLTVAFLTLFERKVFASVQRRKGPEYVGVFGILQPIADALKLLVKEPIIPSRSNMLIFFLAPVVVLFCSIISWLVVPFGDFICWIFTKYGILFSFCFSSLVVYGMLLAGWFSGSRYASLGAIRSISQLISYEVCLSLSVLPIFFWIGSFDLFLIVEKQGSYWFYNVFPLSFFIFFVSALAELNRTPFDLTEAESELVSGYNVEYGSSGFVLFYIAEYLNVVLYSAFISIFFFGGWLALVDLGNLNFIWFPFKVLFFLFIFVIVRASLPRFRYDKLMYLCWQVLFPISFGNLFLFCLFFSQLV